MSEQTAPVDHGLSAPGCAVVPTRGQAEAQRAREAFRVTADPSGNPRSDGTVPAAGVLDVMPFSPTPLYVPAGIGSTAMLFRLASTLLLWMV